MNASWDSPAPTSIPDRSGQWFITTLAAQVSGFLLYPMAICGCHFHAIAVPFGMIPIILGFYLMFVYRSQRERIIA